MRSSIPFTPSPNMSLVPLDYRDLKVSTHVLRHIVVIADYVYDHFSSLRSWTLGSVADTIAASKFLRTFVESSALLSSPECSTRLSGMSGYLVLYRFDGIILEKLFRHTVVVIK